MKLTRFFILCIVTLFGCQFVIAQIVINSDANWKASATFTNNWVNLNFNDASWVGVTSPAKNACTKVIPGTQSMWWSNSNVSNVYIRKLFSLPKLPSSATAQITADNEFKLFVNGVLAGTGDDWSKVYTINILPYLRCGNNVFAIQGIEWVPASCNLVTFQAVIDTVGIHMVSHKASFCKGGKFQFGNGTWTKVGGTYYDTLKSAHCGDSIIHDLVLTELPPNKTNFWVSLCNGKSYQLPTGAYVSKSGIYSDTIKSPKGCDSIVITNISTSPPKQAFDTFKSCEGIGIKLAGGRMVYKSGDYVDTIKQSGCDSIVYSNVTLNPLPIVKPQTTDVTCLGKKDGKVQLSIVGVKYSYINRLIGPGYNTTGYYENLAPGLYSYTVVDTFGCLAKGDFTINEGPSILLQIVPQDTLILPGGSVPLRTICKYPLVNFNWTPPDFLSCTNCSNPIAKPTYNVSYQLYAQANVNGGLCDATAFTRIYISPVFYIPNVFTPNSDGLNEVFKIGGTGLENYQKCNIEIYNSWGERVMYYSEQGMDKFSWDGSYKGKTVPAGIYLFKMHFATIDRQSKTVISEITVVK